MNENTEAKQKLDRNGQEATTKDSRTNAIFSSILQHLRVGIKKYQILCPQDNRQFVKSKAAIRIQPQMIFGRIISSNSITPWFDSDLLSNNGDNA